MDISNINYVSLCIHSLNELSWPKPDLAVHCKLSKSNIFPSVIQLMEPEALASLEPFIEDLGRFTDWGRLPKLSTAWRSFGDHKLSSQAAFLAVDGGDARISQRASQYQNLTEPNAVRKAAVAVISSCSSCTKVIQSYPNSLLIPGHQVRAVADGKGISFPCSPMPGSRGERFFGASLIICHWYSLIVIDCHCYCRVMQSSIGQFGSTVGIDFLCYKLQFFFAQLNPLKGFHFVNFLQFPLRDGCHWPGSRAQLLASSSHTWSCDLMRATSWQVMTSQSQFWEWTLPTLGPGSVFLVQKTIKFKDLPDWWKTVPAWHADSLSSLVDPLWRHCFLFYSCRHG